VPKLNTQKWINSNELLDKCEITRPTLNYYIKLGIVPKPVVRSPEDGLTGYFPAEVIETIDKVKQLKDDGETMEEIVKKVKDSPDEGYNENNEIIKIRFDEKTENVIRDKIGTSAPGLSLTFEDINAPAYLLNYQFEIEWINEYAEEKIFGKKIRTIIDVESRNVFRLFLNWEFSNFIKNWEEIFHYHMHFFKARQEREQITSLYGNISGKEIEYLQKVYDNTNDIPMEKICQQRITFVEKDKPEEQYIVSTIFIGRACFFFICPLTVCQR
jgi:adenylate cyclase